MAIGDLKSVTWLANETARISVITGIDVSNILVSPYGFPTLFRPPLGEIDGSGRLPIMKPEAAEHPVFWFDVETRRQREDENDYEYSIRLYLELVGRGYLHPVTEEVISPLRNLGIYVDTDQGKERIQRYIDGNKEDPELNNLVLEFGETEYLYIGWAEAQAHEFYLEFEDAYKIFCETELAIAEERIQIAIRAIDYTQDLNELFLEINKYLVAIRNNPETTWRSFRSDIKDKFESILEKLNELYTSYYVIKARCLQLTNHGAELDKTLKKQNDDEEQRIENFDNILTALYTTLDPYKSVYNLLDYSKKLCEHAIKLGKSSAEEYQEIIKQNNN